MEYRETITLKDGRECLLRNGVDSGMQQTLSLKNGWTASFKDLPKYDKDGNEIVYTIREQSIDGPWSPVYGTVEPVANAHNAYRVSITNVCTLTYLLPETGGAGTLPYTLGGVMLLLAAGVLLLYKRKVVCGKGGAASS